MKLIQFRAQLPHQNAVFLEEFGLNGLLEIHVTILVETVESQHFQESVSLRITHAPAGMMIYFRLMLLF